VAPGDRYKVWVEIDPKSGLPIRIVKSRYEVYSLPLEKIAFWPRSEAVGLIRKQIFDRDKDCQRCGKTLTRATMHMDEKVSKGEGGEVSLKNCWALCYECHEGNKSTSEHGNRMVRFGESNDQV
jgi:5-methylcytosine-specific restriction endonuclease McrA